jgi:F-type H+-transporting ATPase subunit epsilon
MALNIRLMTPDGIYWDKLGDQIILPTTTGPIGILQGHASLITALEIGVLRYQKDKVWKAILTLGGGAIIKADTVTILVSGVEEVVKDNFKSTEAQSILTNASKRLEDSETLREKIAASQNFKRANIRVEMHKFLES